MSQLIERTSETEILAELHQIEALKEVKALERKRLLKAALAEKIPQKFIANAMGISQPAVAKALKGAATVPDVLDGFDGATPYEVCQRYAAGLIRREAMIEELAEWPYAKTPIADEYGDYQGNVTGTFDDVVIAKRMGLIDREDYAEIVARFTAS